MNLPSAARRVQQHEVLQEGFLTLHVVTDGGVQASNACTSTWCRSGWWRSVPSVPIWQAFRPQAMAYEPASDSTALPVSGAQAGAIKEQFKVLAQLLTGPRPDRNHYQGIFVELYRRLGVSSYKLIPQSNYHAALTFLEEWCTSASSPSSKGEDVS